MDILQLIMHPPGYEWVDVKDIVAGDKVRWWDMDEEVLSVSIDGEAVSIEVVDSLSGNTKFFVYKAGEELSVKRATGV